MNISVVIPVYNTEKYLRECLESCISQNFDDAEFICVNDGSSDSSLSVLEEYASKDPRIKIISQENKGLSGARNTGIRAACGERIMFLDSDDKLKAGALEKLHAVSLNNDADVIIFCADTFPALIEDNPWYKKTLQFPKASYSSFSPKVLFNERGSMPFVWRHCYKKELLDKTGVLFDEGLKYGEDVEFPMTIFPQAQSFCFAEDIILSYRLAREGSLMSEGYADKAGIVEKHFEIIRRTGNTWKEKGWLDKWGKAFDSWALKFVILKIKALPGADKARYLKKFRSLLKEIKHGSAD